MSTTTNPGHERSTTLSIPPVAIVTGAGSGIGREICLLLAEAGYRLTLVGRREAALRSTLDAINQLVADPPGVLAVRADLSDPRQAASIVDRTLQHWKRVDALVNNAAILDAAPIDETTQELLRDAFAVNVFAPALLVAHLWEVFARQHSGCIVNISSAAASDPFAGLSVYAMTKSALESLTRSVVNEGQPLGIRAYCIAPGAVETPMLRSFISTDQLPAEQTLEPKQVAEVVVDCVLGNREADLGRTIELPSP